MLIIYNPNILCKDLLCPQYASFTTQLCLGKHSVIHFNHSQEVSITQRPSLTVFLFGEVQPPLNTAEKITSYVEAITSDDCLSSDTIKSLAKQMDGKFACILYNHKSEKLIIFRDRTGRQDLVHGLTTTTAQAFCTQAHNIPEECVFTYDTLTTHALVLHQSGITECVDLR